MRIAVDTPPIIIEKLQKVDVSKISKKRMNELYSAGQKLLSQYPQFTRPLERVEMRNIIVSNEIPQKFGDLLSQINYAGLNFIVRKTAETMMLKWISNNLPMRK